MRFLLLFSARRRLELGRARDGRKSRRVPSRHPVVFRRPQLHRDGDVVDGRAPDPEMRGGVVRHRRVVFLARFAVLLVKLGAADEIHAEHRHRRPRGSVPADGVPEERVREEDGEHNLHARVDGGQYTLHLADGPRVEPVRQARGREPSVQNRTPGHRRQRRPLDVFDEVLRGDRRHANLRDDGCREQETHRAGRRCYLC
mmetsp:Transcript_12507/g.52418  ORF Transcript_12507/g.52418 Transcript_12507/m.52418 type:complete len:200 (-) Transcript_12507:92-691(-)